MDIDKEASRLTFDRDLAREVAALVRRGIAEERARCAAIADLYVSQARPAGDEDVGDCPLAAYFNGQKIVAQNILGDIRNGV
jgi:hypothetical protein